jgi:hypothetical protein
LEGHNGCGDECQVSSDRRYAIGRIETLERLNTPLRMRCADLVDELIWLRRGGTVPLAHNHAIEGGPEMYERNAPCPRCEQIKALLEKQFADAPGVDVTAADNVPEREAQK